MHRSPTSASTGVRARFSLYAALLLTTSLAPGVSSASGDVAHPERSFSGRVLDAAGAPLPGAMLSFASAAPVHRLTVYSQQDGSYRTPLLPFPGPYQVRVRRVGWRDLHLERAAVPDGPLDLTLAREDDPAAVAAQLPANYWLARVLERLEDPAQREEFVRQCGFCHQQGSLHTRVARDPEEWRKVILLMGRKGGMLSADLRDKLPEILIDAYDPERAVPELTAGMQARDFGPLAAADVRGAVVEEWDLGGPGSVQHDVMLHPDGRLYGVDMPFDKLHRLDPATGERRSWQIPSGGLPIGGVFAGRNSTPDPSSNERVGPHSLQAAPNGDVWITLATGNRLARFDPQTEQFEIIELEHGFYPHTLRFDAEGRIWYTISASNTGCRKTARRLRKSS